MYSPFRQQATMIAKKHDISMFLCTEKIIEIAELDDSKAIAFIRDIKNLSKDTKIIDLIQTNQNIDINGYDITGDKSKYLVDDDYYREITGDIFYRSKVVKEIPIGQVKMFH